MHIPPPFRRDDPATLQSAMRRFQTATLVSHGASGLMATHVPIEVAEWPSPLGRLRCHFARANPHAEMIAEADEMLAIFHGPEGYISPNWYPSKAHNSKVVPTWNYATIHAYGTAKSFTDPNALRALVGKLTDRYEARQATPWSIDDAPDDYIDSMLSAIIGIEITVSRLEGKWKMSQNRSAEDQQGVIHGLQAQGDPGSLALADEIQKKI